MFITMLHRNLNNTSNAEPRLSIHISIYSTDYGTYKLEVKSKTSNGVEFTTAGNSNHDSGKVGGSLETKYKYSDYGESTDSLFKALLYG